MFCFAKSRRNWHALCFVTINLIFINPASASVIDDKLRAEVDELLNPIGSANTEQAAPAAATSATADTPLTPATPATAAPEPTTAVNPTTPTTSKIPAADISFIKNPSASTLNSRAVFAEFLQALDNKDTAKIASLQNQLRDYPLYSFVEYTQLRDQFPQKQDAQIQQFIENNKDNFLAAYMRGLLLNKYAQNYAWRDFIKYDDGRSGVENDCRRLAAAISLKQDSEPQLMARAAKFYMVPKSQSAGCDDVFAWYLPRLGSKQNKIILERINLALKAKQLNFVKTLQAAAGDKLSAAQNAAINSQLEAIGTIKRQPDLIFSAKYQADTAANRDLALIAINSMLADSLERAEAGFSQLNRRYKFKQHDILTTRALLAKRSAQRHYDDAIKRFAALPQAAYNDDLHEWHARAAIRVQNWHQLRQAINAMPKNLREQNEWRYWLARAEQHVGSLQVARLLLEQVAPERSYYGFLAAERLGYNYSFNNKPSQIDSALVWQLSQRPQFIRLREWLFHQQYNYARAELRSLLRLSNRAEKVAIAHMVDEFGWYEQGVRIMAALKQFDDLPLRFPLAYRQPLELYSKDAGISADWAQAIMRRESGYAFDARSRVGATGLMQLMPATAKMLAREQQWQFAGDDTLLHAETNIRYGTTYLGQLNQQFAGFIPLATAAYNAGPHRVNKWLPNEKSIPLDIWIGTIPFPETRKYVQAVSEYMTVFKWRAAGEPSNFKRSLSYIDQVVLPPTANAQLAAQ